MLLLVFFPKVTLLSLNKIKYNTTTQLTETSVWLAPSWKSKKFPRKTNVKIFGLVYLVKGWQKRETV